MSSGAQSRLVCVFVALCDELLDGWSLTGINNWCSSRFWLLLCMAGQACLHQSVLRCFGSMRCTMPAPLRAAHSPTLNFQSFGCLGVSSGSTDGFTSRSIMRSLTYCFKRSYGTCPTFGDEGANTFIATHPKRTSESGKSNQNLASGKGKVGIWCLHNFSGTHLKYIFSKRILNF